MTCSPSTAGQEKFRSLTSSYYRGTQGIILGLFVLFYLMLLLCIEEFLFLFRNKVYDVTSRESFQHLNIWLNEIEMYCNNSDVVKLLVGNSSPPASLTHLQGGLSLSLLLLFLGNILKKIKTNRQQDRFARKASVKRGGRCLCQVQGHGLHRVFCKDKAWHPAGL